MVLWIYIAGVQYHLTETCFTKIVSPQVAIHMNTTKLTKYVENISKVFASISKVFRNTSVLNFAKTFHILSKILPTYFPKFLNVSVCLNFSNTFQSTLSSFKYFGKYLQILFMTISNKYFNECLGNVYKNPNRSKYFGIYNVFRTQITIQKIRHAKYFANTLVSYFHGFVI